MMGGCLGRDCFRRPRAEPESASNEHRVPASERLASQPEIAPPPTPGLRPVASPITLDDVTNFLYGEVRARRTARRERLSAQMF